MPPLASQRVTDAAGTEASLIARAQAGDVGAFERLSGAYADRLFMLLLRLLGDRDEAEDVAQEVMLRAWPAAISSCSVANAALAITMCPSIRLAAHRIGLATTAGLPAATGTITSRANALVNM